MHTTMGTNLQYHDRCMNNHNAESTHQPVSKGYGHTIHKSAEENHGGKARKIPVRENHEQTNGKCVKVNSYQEDAKLQCLGV